MDLVRPATVLFAMGLVLLAFMATAQATRRPVPQSHLAEYQTEHLIAINHADQDTLSVLPGIGATMAQRVMEYRESHGQFQSVDDLLLVPGIGHKTLRRLRPMITLWEGVSQGQSGGLSGVSSGGD